LLTKIETADGSPTLFSERYGESFHSTFGAETESRYVFLKASGVLSRLASSEDIRVLEIGFGLGLNALLTADTAAMNSATLSYHSIELDRSVCKLAQQVDYHPLLQDKLMTGKLKNALLAASGCDATKTVVQLAERCKLTIRWGDATTAPLPATPFDAIYLDAFSPDNNPECWTQEFMLRMKAVLAKNGTLSTYCVKGTVRRAMLAAGFSVTKLPGPPGKREILVASHGLLNNR